MKKITVLIIDDSSVIRNLVREILSYDEAIQVVGEAKDPYVARDLIKSLNPDVLTLDIEMPKMDGITFLKNLMRLRPMPVIMLSTLTTQGANITLEALELGAVDFIAKPSFNELQQDKYSFKDSLIEKVKFAGTIDQKSNQLTASLTREISSQILPFSGVGRPNHVVAIGSSTGGTEAIKQIITKLPVNAPPILVAQHIPATFSARFAERVNTLCQVEVQEAQHGQKIKEGNVYIAPGDKHLKVGVKGGGLFCVLEDSAPVNRHKPSVDVLFESLRSVANNSQAILLTGMGKDGAQGMLTLKNNGAFTLIQDQASSLVWGMPGSAFKLNAHLEQSALANIAEKLLAVAQLKHTPM